jgi:hypothetical protein
MENFEKTNFEIKEESANIKCDLFLVNIDTICPIIHTSKRIAGDYGTISNYKSNFYEES